MIEIRWNMILNPLTHLALALVQCNANHIVNSTNAVIRSRVLKQCAMSLFLSCHSIGAKTVSHVANCVIIWHHWIFRWRWLKWDATWPFWSCDTISNPLRLMVSSMTPLHSLGQDNWNEVQHDFCDHVMPLALVSHQWHHQWCSISCLNEDNS